MMPSWVLALTACLSGVGAQAVLAQQTVPPTQAHEARALQVPLARLESAAADGDAGALYLLGLRYHAGQGVLQDFGRAADLFAKAAAQDNAAAQAQLAKYLYEGIGVARDIDTAMVWFGRAAQAGAAQHQFDYAVALENRPVGAVDPAHAAQWYQKAVDQGHEDAAVNLGVLYQNGAGVAQDLDRARGLYQGPAAAGNGRAQNNLGLMYARGEGVAQDYGRAPRLFAAAADRGVAQAMTNLGVMYENAFGVPLDEARAGNLYRQGGRYKTEIQSNGPAAPLYDPRFGPPDTSPEGLARMMEAVRAGDPVAQFQAGWLVLDRGDATHRELVRAAQMLHAAAQAGLPAAMANLGWMYFEGRGLPQDYVLGYMWLMRASAAGLRDAVALNAVLSRNMLPTQVTEAQALAAQSHD
ncbi:SEL1-like repeat protein [Salipiger aestuarii]|uniref:SEL1-like repeat protein n=1 Tax=Salipiger aestuarii TaxID=568098 RepID=UPI00123C43EB|nr:SEL1-like repeat protein [Salipiger aestuarii]